MDDKKTASKKEKCWRYTAILFILCTAGLVVTLVVVAVRSQQGSQHLSPTRAPPCGAGGEEVDLTEPDNPGPFHSLTTKELSRLMDYLFSQSDLKLVSVSKTKLDASYVYSAELFLPPKQATLNFLDHNAPQPPRKAKVTIFRGDNLPPVSEEYIVTLTEGAMSHAPLRWKMLKTPIPYNYRPLCIAEWHGVDKYLIPEIDRILGRLLKESYDATFQNCGNKCISTNYRGILTSGVLGTSNVRQYWISSEYLSEFGSLNPIDFSMAVDLSGTDPAQFSIQQVLYNNQSFPSLEALAAAYDKGEVKVTRLTFPERSRDAFSTSYRRGPPVPLTPRRPPRLVEPDGRRFSVRHQHVSYMQWSANVHLAASTGPQLLDIRFQGERIAYEISLQEVVVFYSAANSPAHRHADFLDSAGLLGPYTRSLVPETDCPNTAVFLNVPMQVDKSDKPTISKRAFCIFEQNTGVPLRRHAAPESWAGSFYYGLMDHVLVVRSILYVVNYDYIIDFMLHQSGAIEVVARATGFIFPSFYTPSEDPYGFRLRENILGTMHHHLYHFKVDLDVLGTANRYETLDIVPEKVDNSRWTGKPGSTKWQTKFDRNLKRTEMEAAYDYNFDTPKYHIVHNDLNKTKYGVPRSYRLHLTGLSKNLRPNDAENDIIAAWARHQVVVTKYKDDERTSTWPGNQYATRDPLLNFTQFYADNDNIVDKDLVFWVTLGSQHIPHTEDLPMTPTAGEYVALALLPYNYFPECPAMASRDATRIHLSEDGRSSRLEAFSPKSESSCESHVPDFQKYLDQHPDAILDIEH